MIDDQSAFGSWNLAVNVRRRLHRTGLHREMLSDDLDGFVADCSDKFPAADLSVDLWNSQGQKRGAGFALSNQDFYVQDNLKTDGQLRYNKNTVGPLFLFFRVEYRCAELIDFGGGVHEIWRLLGGPNSESWKSWRLTALVAVGSHS